MREFIGALSQSIDRRILRKRRQHSVCLFMKGDIRLGFAAKTAALIFGGS
jgi:hypothetical protein